MSAVAHEALALLRLGRGLGVPLALAAATLREAGVAVTSQAECLAEYCARDAACYLGLPLAGWGERGWRAALGVAIIDLALRSAGDGDAPAAAGLPLTRIK